MLEERIRQAGKFFSYDLKTIPVKDKYIKADNFFDFIKDLMDNHGKEWYAANIAPENTFIPCTFHFLGGGMFLRNHMRDMGYGEQYFDVDCIDDIYTRVAEIAVLGHEL